jgi:rhodanese-related sulfurtransferase
MNLCGHVAGSINIPLNEIPHRMQEIQELKAPLVLCCASGNRSGQAQVFLCTESNAIMAVRGLM